MSTALFVAATADALYDLPDEQLAGPTQPIAFSHRVHATVLQIGCLYCHTGAESSQSATIPAVSVCMGCHTWVKKGATEGSEAEIAKIADYYARGESIPWIRVHNLPEYVQFKHNMHVVPGKIECQRCHGPVETMDQVYLVPETVYNPSSAWLPAAKLEMGWCVTCHNQNAGPRDCIACHY